MWLYRCKPVWKSAREMVPHRVVSKCRKASAMLPPLWRKQAGWVNGNDDGTTHSTLHALNLGLDGTLHLALPLCLGEMLAVGLWDRNAATIHKSGECMSKHLRRAAAHSLTYDLRDDPVCMRR